MGGYDTALGEKLREFKREVISELSAADVAPDGRGNGEIAAFGDDGAG